jgi:transcriptional regulator with XRE-family HTH domain
MNLTQKTQSIIRESQITFLKLARLSGVDHGSLSSFMSGKRGLGTERIEKVLNALGYDIEIVKRECGRK